MDYTITQTSEELGKRAAQKIAEIINREVARKGKAVIGMATGSTYIPVYKELVAMYDRGEVDFANVVTFNLDEYVVDRNEHPDFYERYESYHGFMREHLFRHVNIKPENIHIPDGMAADPVKACQDFEDAIKVHGGIDLQLLGIGENGHIGFNEPGNAPINGRTTMVELTQSTVDVNRNKFGFAATHALTMGLGTIMDAKEILLLAIGKEKAPIMKKTGRGIPHRPENPTFMDEVMREVQHNPSRLLGYHHNAHAILDAAAADQMLIKSQELKR